MKNLHKPEIIIADDGEPYLLLDDIGEAEKYFGKSWWTKQREKEIEQQKRNGTFGINPIAILYGKEIFNDSNKHYLGNSKYHIQKIIMTCGTIANIIWDSLDWMKLQNAEKQSS